MRIPDNNMQPCTLYIIQMVDDGGGNIRNVPIVGFQMLFRADYESRDEVQELKSSLLSVSNPKMKYTMNAPDKVTIYYIIWHCR